MKDSKQQKIDPNKTNILFSWLESPNSVRFLIYGLIAACVIVFTLDFSFNRYGHFKIEEYPGFFAIFGFVMFSLIIFGAKGLRLFLKRPEDFYGNKSVDGETKIENQAADND